MLRHDVSLGILSQDVTLLGELHSPMLSWLGSGGLIALFMARRAALDGHLQRTDLLYACLADLDGSGDQSKKPSERVADGCPV